jgi:hypothetical protein
MQWVLRLVETGSDGQSRSSDVVAISRPDDLNDVANLGLTLDEAKAMAMPSVPMVGKGQVRNIGGEPVRKSVCEA